MYLKRNSILRKYIENNISCITSYNVFRFVLDLVIKLRKFGVKERYIKVILEDCFRGKYWNFIESKHVWIKLSSNNEYKTFYELIDPEMHILCSMLYVNVPIEYLKKSYVLFWKMDPEPDYSLLMDETAIVDAQVSQSTFKPDFLIVIDQCLGKYFKLRSLKKLLYIISEPENRISINTSNVVKSRRIKNGNLELTVTEKYNQRCQYNFCFTISKQAYEQLAS